VTSQDERLPGERRFSAVIPAYNEERYLPRLLDTLDAARAGYARGPGAIEVIVADNGSTDRTAEIARERGCRVVAVEKRVISAARNGGARAATGDVLAFMDADLRVDPRTFDAIDETLATGRIVGGATGVRMERMSVGLAVTYALMMPMVWGLRMDTGVTFCRRSDFEAIGGYDETRRFAEDVAFLFALRRLGLPRGQRLARVTKAKAIACLRKFDEHGDWHYLSMTARFALRAIRGPAAFDALVERYWYAPRR